MICVAQQGHYIRTRRRVTTPATMADEIRKWHAMIAKNTIGTTETAESDAPTLRDYVTMAESATLVMQAKQCIVNALITDTVTWTDDPDRDVPHELYTFIETAVDYLMITGALPPPSPLG